MKLLNLKDSSSICLRFILHSKVREVPATLPPGIGKLQTEAMYFDECGSNHCLNNGVQLGNVNENTAVLIVLPY